VASTTRSLSTGVVVGLFLVLVISWIFFLVGLGLQAGYENADAQVTYSTPLTTALLYRLLSLATLDTVFRYLEWFEWLFLVVSAAGFVIVAIAVKGGHTKLVLGALASQFILLYPGWVGLFTLPFALWYGFSGSIDGEWIGEGWPSLEAIGLWLAGCMVVVLSVGFRGALRPAQ
jgi:hypothetical protein